MGQDVGLAKEVHDDHRTNSSFAAYFNIICLVAGTGVLALPATLAESGWFGILLFGITAICSILTSKMLIECLYYKEGSRLQEYPEVAEAAFGKTMSNITKVFHYSVSLSGGCIYILVSGVNISTLLEAYAPSVDVHYRFFILISGLIVGVPFVLLKTLREVTLLGVFGALTTLISVLCVTIQGSFQYASLNASLTKSPEYDTIRLSGLPTALATIAFSYGGNVVFPHVEATMRNPKAWNKTVFFAVASITFMYVLMGATGYLYYGKGVKAPVFLSMGNNAGSTLGMVLITLHVLLAAPIFLCSFSMEQERVLNFEAMAPAKQFLSRVVFRGALVSALTLIAMFIPYFKRLMAVFGAVSNSLMIFVVPVACHYKLFGFGNRSIVSHATSLFIFLLGLFVLFVGSFFAISELVTAVINGETI